METPIAGAEKLNFQLTFGLRIRFDDEFAEVQAVAMLSKAIGITKSRNGTREEFVSRIIRKGKLENLHGKEDREVPLFSKEGKGGKNKKRGCPTSSQHKAWELQLIANRLIEMKGSINNEARNRYSILVKVFDGSGIAYFKLTDYDVEKLLKMSYKDLSSSIEEFILCRADTYLVDEIEGISGEQSFANENAFYCNIFGKSKKGNMYGLGQLGNEFLALTQCTQSDPNPSFNYQEVIANLNAELAQKDTKIQTIESELATTKSILQQVVNHLGLSHTTFAIV
ncbi:hypothetical protein E2542_SST01146 [Spatholobus suberectus]|nr:hypothetical protein E2542_SST01146 [Spatholobus suberectus]